MGNPRHCKAGAIQLKGIPETTVNFRLLVREKAKIHRSHKRVFNGLVVDSRFQVGCPKIATRIHACTKFPIQNSRPSARMRGFSSRFLDNQLEIDCIYTMWFNSIVPPLHGFCVCMDVSMTSNLKFTVQCFASWLSMCKVEF